jgi:hypothetical protein
LCCVSLTCYGRNCRVVPHALPTFQRKMYWSIKALPSVLTNTIRQVSQFLLVRCESWFLFHKRRVKIWLSGAVIPLQ